MSDPLDDLIQQLRLLRDDQLDRVSALVKILAQAPDHSYSQSGFATEPFVHRFGDALRLHHLYSNEPFTKDKFEHAMVTVLKGERHKAELARRGNPGHDLTVGEERWSLKTQADANIRRDTLHISKFMELGKGKWESKEDLAGLRDQMLHHMEAYDRIFSLRCFRSALEDGGMLYEYELVEIPKSLLLQARGGALALMESSRQTPKPGYCTVSEKGLLLFRLYFDGGTERKLQIKDLSKGLCKVLATWRIKVAPL